MFRMKARSICFRVVLTAWCLQLVTCDFVSFDEHPDVGHDEDIHPNTLSETYVDALDMNTNMESDDNVETNWNEPVDASEDNYEDADWHPPTVLQETHSDLHPGAPLVMHGGISAAEDATNQTLDQTVVGSPARCGEYSSQLTSTGQCRLIATLPPVGRSQKHCPDIFRCTDDVSYWLHENRDRKGQLGELRETTSGLQEELRNHRHRVKVLEMQVGRACTVEEVDGERCSTSQVSVRNQQGAAFYQTVVVSSLCKKLGNAIFLSRRPRVELS